MHYSSDRRLPDTNSGHKMGGDEGVTFQPETNHEFLDRTALGPVTMLIWIVSSPSLLKRNKNSRLRTTVGKNTVVHT
jgi:hypothetical protein